MPASAAGGRLPRLRPRAPPPSSSARSRDGDRRVDPHQLDGRSPGRGSVPATGASYSGVVATSSSRATTPIPSRPSAAARASGSLSWRAASTAGHPWVLTRDHPAVDGELVVDDVVGLQVARQRVEHLAVVVPGRRPVAGERQHQEVAGRRVRRGRLERSRSRRGRWPGAGRRRCPRRRRASAASGSRAAATQTSDPRRALRQRPGEPLGPGREQHRRQRRAEREEAPAVTQEAASGDVAGEAADASRARPTTARPARSRPPRARPARPSYDDPAGARGQGPARRRRRPPARPASSEREHDAGAGGRHHLGVPDPAEGEGRERRRQRPLRVDAEDGAGRARRGAVEVQQAGDDPGRVGGEHREHQPDARPRRVSPTPSSTSADIRPALALSEPTSSRKGSAAPSRPSSRKRAPSATSHGSTAQQSSSGQCPIQSRSTTNGVHT